MLLFKILYIWGYVRVTAFILTKPSLSGSKNNGHFDPDSDSESDCEAKKAGKIINAVTLEAMSQALDNLFFLCYTLLNKKKEVLNPLSMLQFKEIAGVS